MKFSLDRSFRIIWLIVGGLVLVTLLIAGGLVVAQLVGNAGAGKEAVRIVESAATERTEARAVRYGEPTPIRGTATRMVLVGNGQGHERGAGYASGDYGGGNGPQVNVIFLDAEGARLLLDRPAFIRDVDAPGPTRTPPAGEPVIERRWIAYVMAVDDSDGNGRLDERDATGLYVTDLDGRALRPVLRPPLRYRTHEALDASRMLVYALEPPAGKPVDEERMRQRAFIYDVATGQLSPYAALDSAAARAAQILAR
jgi:hypothetical protein